jgi:hypothetical protein
MSHAYQYEPDYEPRAVAIPDRTTAAGLWLILGSLIFLQRFSIGGVPIAFGIGYLVLVALFLLRVVIIDAAFLVFFLVAAAVASLSVIWWPGDASFSSFLYLLAIYALYMLRFRNRAASFAIAQHIFLKCMLIAAVAGIAQFMAQFVLGPERVFPFEYLPEFIKAQNYNVIIPLTYGSPIVKSNGLFFLEPSFFSQFLAIAFILELLGRQRPIRSGIYLFALLISYSGTGLLTAAIFAPFALMRKVNVPIILGAIVVGIVVALCASVFEFNTLFGRVDEFTAPESSGFARFVSPFYLIRDFLIPSPDNFLFGMGPGTIDAALKKATFHAYLAHDPTWIKLIFEYGLVGGLAILSYVFCAVYAGGRDRLFSTVLLFAWLALGGYLLNGMMNVLFVTLGVMHAWPATRTQERPLTPRRARMTGRPVGRQRYPSPMPGTPRPN